MREQTASISLQTLRTLQLNSSSRFTLTDLAMEKKTRRTILPTGKPPSLRKTVANMLRRKNPPQLLRIYFHPGAIKKLSPNELDLFIVFSLALNEMNAIIKMHFLLSLQNYPDETQALYAECHKMALMKVYAGKVYEAWEAVRSRYFGTALSKKLDKELPGHALDNLYFIKRYFAKRDNAIQKIRNEAAFHFPRKSLSYTAKYLKSRKRAAVYYDMHHDFNNLYVAGEFMSWMHYLNELEVYSADSYIGLENEIGEVAAQLQGFVVAVLGHIIDDLMVLSGSRTKADILTISEKVSTADARVPVIVDVRKHLKEKAEAYRSIDRVNRSKFQHLRRKRAKK